MIINHQRNRFKGINIESIKKELYKYYHKNLGIASLQLDHIIPFSISLDSSKANLQLLTKREHNEKSVIDRKIIKIFRKKDWIEKITNYSHELKKPIAFFKKEYLKIFNLTNKFKYTGKKFEND